MSFVRLAIYFIPAFTILIMGLKLSSAFQVRSAAAQFQEHVQADAAAEEVAGGGGLDDGDLRLHRQDRRAGEEAEEADLHRGIDKGGAGAAL